MPSRLAGRCDRRACPDGFAGGPQAIEQGRYLRKYAQHILSTHRTVYWNSMAPSLQSIFMSNRLDNSTYNT